MLELKLDTKEMTITAHWSWDTVEVSGSENSETLDTFINLR